jgi:hypothetical protein
MMRKKFLPRAVFAALWFALLVYAQAQQFNPAPGSPVVVGEGSGRIVLADVNRDGKLDLITQHLQQHFVAAQLGDGTGRFALAPGSPIKLAYSPSDIKLGDINSDGALDLAITGGERDAIDIYFGVGDGRFNRAPGSPFLVSASTEFITGLQLVDINEDGKLDIVTTSNQRNSFSVLLGNGRGGLAPGPTTTFPAGQGRYAFAFGDLDGDGHLDVVTANSGGGLSSEPCNVVVLRGDGKGSFKKLTETHVPPGTRWIALGDLNGDQRRDLALNHNGDQLSILLNQGGGMFTSGSTYDLGAGAFAVTVADVDQDKRNDLIVATADSVTVLLNGKNGFASAPGSPFRAGPGAYFFAIGDLNRDGKTDIAASSFEGKEVTVLLGY